MKHCANPDCPHRRESGRLAEYRDTVSECSHCKGPLSDGAAPEIAPKASPLVRVGTFATPHEAHLARATLASHGIDGVVYHDHAPYLTASSWVQLEVPRRDAVLAREVLERGPVHEAGPEAAADRGPPPPASDPSDDMRPGRLRRRFVLARWFLYAQTIAGLLWTPVVVAGRPAFGLLLFLEAGLAFATAVGSIYAPRRAFGVALGLETVLLIQSLAIAGPTGLTVVIPGLAVLFAWLAAAPQPPERLQASPLQLASPAIAIGDAWKESGPPEPAARARIRWARVGLVALVLIVGIVALAIGLDSPALKNVVHGSTAFSLEADRASALRQELELGRARLAHALGESKTAFKAIDAVPPDAIEVRGLEANDVAAGTTVLGELFPGWTISRNSDGDIRAAMGPETQATIVEAALDQVVTGLREELDISVSIARDPSGTRIELAARVPGRWSRDVLRAWFERPLLLEMRRVRYPPGIFDAASWIAPATREAVLTAFGGRLPARTGLIAQPTGVGETIYWPLESVPVIVGRDVIDAQSTLDDFGSPAILFELSADAGRRLAAATERMVGRKMAIVLRDTAGAEVVSVPVILGTIGTEGLIQGGASIEEADALAQGLRAGSRPMWVELGEDAKDD